jgi:hypothetical protein
MSANALALRIKKISGGKGDASKVKMLTFYYALKAAGLFSLASFALGRMKVMDKELFSELELDLGMSDGIESNDIINSGIENKEMKVENIKIENNQIKIENNGMDTDNLIQIKDRIKIESKIEADRGDLEVPEPLPVPDATSERIHVSAMDVRNLLTASNAAHAKMIQDSVSSYLRFLILNYLISSYFTFSNDFCDGFEHCQKQIVLRRICLCYDCHLHLTVLFLLY